MEVCSFPRLRLFDLPQTERVLAPPSLSPPVFLPLRWDPVDPRRLASTNTSMPKKQSSAAVAPTSLKKRKRMAVSTNKSHKDVTLESLQDNLDYLLDEWASIDIVLGSLRGAFTIHPLESASEEYLDEVDRELSIAYDDLMAQVRHLDRSLKRLHSEMAVLRQQPDLSSPSPRPHANIIKHQLDEDYLDPTALARP